MAIKYGQVNVDEKFKPVVLPNLFYKTWMIPGVTYQDVSSDNNGAWYWHKITSTGAPAPKLPGQDFEDVAAADTLVQCTFNNNYQRSKKIYNVQAAAVAYPIAEEHLALAINEVGEGKGLSGLACLITEGTAATGTDAITPDNFQQTVLGVRKEIVKAKGTADVVLCSPDFFATMLDYAGNKYTPTTNEKILAAAAGGQVGNYLGMLWIEVNGFSHNAQITYNNEAGQVKNVTQQNLSKVDFIMYDHTSLGIGDNFNMARLRDSERFSGTLAQVEDNVGFKVLDKAVVRVRSTNTGVGA